ncbi:hypothetical protein HF086_015458 [Spodoptera exigua]|uniref:Nose resistant-to-fluoxetine protein N-terminal domain-containing protein n=1 Tax=Spodoptera exigua TaxID=7107 RepID=A0A922MWD7_SPOEX|nr:hypothetical protein HF086_015458 [Spodoptera exigua]
MKLLVLLFLISILKNGCVVNAHLDMVVPDHKNVFDLNLYESVLDPKLCEEQLKHMLENDQELLFEFFDAGIRTPRGILTGGTLDLGNYHQCLGIHKETPKSVVEGKYCMINVPLDQDWPSLPSTPSLPDITWPDITWPPQNQRYLKWRKHVAKKSSELRMAMAGFDTFTGTTNNSSSPLAALTFRLGVCVPKACTPRTAINTIFGGLQTTPIEFEESYCRLPKDKHWVAGDYVALVIFGIFILLVALSTAYDIRYNVFLQKDPKKINKLCLAFSAYTNTRRLVTYKPVPGTLECLDGIRSFAMMWVIIGHTFVTQTQSQIMGNPADALAWMTSLQSIWITAAPITVDTFFTLSGLLLVYTTAGKLTSLKLLKNLHLFYLNRLLRMFPVLAACLSHSWYLAIDVQLHILSPIVLVWILTGKRRLAWSALVGSLIAVLAAATTYNFIKKFPSGPVIPSRPLDTPDYLINYYVNTLTRASPFFVGLIFGYILHLNRGKKIVINFYAAAVMWICTTVIALLIVYSSYPIMQLDWDNQFADSMINSFMRPAWAMFIGWMILACEHGYGGPVNWILSLRAWKVLGRLSYAMYLIHYPLMFVVLAMPIAPIYFDVQFSVSYYFLLKLNFLSKIIKVVFHYFESIFYVYGILNRTEKTTSENCSNYRNRNR